MTRPWDRIERTTKVRVCAHRSARVGRLACSKMAIFCARLQEGVKSAQREKCTLKEVKKASTYGLGTQAHSRACLVLSACLSLSFLASSHHLLLGHALLLLGPFDAPQLPVSTTGSKMIMSAHPHPHTAAPSTKAWLSVQDTPRTGPSSLWAGSPASCGQRTALSPATAKQPDRGEIEAGYASSEGEKC